MPTLALKIDIDTLVGTQLGVPRLIDLLKQHGAGATFLFSLGPDRTGRAIKRVFRPGFFSKVQRTSVVKHYGVKTLLYGTALPSPDIGKRTQSILRRVRDEGFEVGVHTWDHVTWQDNVQSANCDWTEQQFGLAMERFAEIFNQPAKTHGAAGWQMNRHALRLTERYGLNYASDCRGTHPFVPVWDGEIVSCPQLPTTLPTLDELIGLPNITEANVHEHLLQLTKSSDTGARDHVYTLHAELEGRRLASAFEQLLIGWKEQGYTLTSTQDYFSTLNIRELPLHNIQMGSLEGRSGVLLKQGKAFLH
jgi:undecaprenyl phosphate-alpha-L-ara4FN deformylase